MSLLLFIIHVCRSTMVASGFRIDLTSIEPNSYRRTKNCMSLFIHKNLFVKEKASLKTLGRVLSSPGK